MKYEIMSKAKLVAEPYIRLFCRLSQLFHIHRLYDVVLKLESCRYWILDIRQIHEIFKVQ